MFISIFRLFLVAFLCAAAPCSWAADHIVERAYFEDPGGRLTLAEVQAKPLTPYVGMLSRGYTQSAIWLRLTIDPKQSAAASNMPATLVLRVRPTVLDEIALFDPLQPMATPRVVGDRHPWSNNEYQSLNFNFVIPLSDASRVVWLRLKTSSSSLILVEALTPQENAQGDRRTELIYSALIAAQLLFIAWAFINWFTTRDRLVVAFFAKQLAITFYVLAFTGYFRVFLSDLMPAIWLDKLTSLTFMPALGAAIVFDYLLLREYSPPRWGMRALLLSLAILPFEVVLISLDIVQPALQTHMLLNLILPLLVLGIAISVKGSRAVERSIDSVQPPPLTKAILVSYYLLIILIMSPSTLPNLGLMQGYDFAINSYMIYGLVSGTLMIILLQFRSYRLTQSRLVLQKDLAMSQRQTELEHQKSLEQAQFMSMLAHELKTPLSVMHMALGSTALTPDLVAHANKAVLDMNSVIERCLQVDKLDDRQVQVQTRMVALDAELHDLQRNSPDPERIQLDGQTGMVLHTDAQLLRIVLANLVDNALKYSVPASVVTVVVATDDALGARPGVSLVVQNIPGVAGWPNATRVFQKYYRNPQAHHQTGSGLGLYLVSSLARLLGGEVRYTPDETHVRFTLWLPR